MDRVVLAYSGGLDSSVALARLTAPPHADIVTVTVDLGQERELEAVRDRALALGAVRAHVIDLRDEFARDYILPSLKADALYDHRSPMAAALGRPLIARTLVGIADIEHAGTVAHGDGRRGGAVSLDVLLRALDPARPILAPAREWGASTAEAVAYARQHGIPVAADAGGPYRADANLWGRTIEYPASDETSREPPEDVFRLTKAARECPDEPACVEIAYQRGAPTAINGVQMPLLELITSLGTIAAAHGVGRTAGVAHRIGDATLREVSEAPAAVLLHAAHRELGARSATRDFERFARIVSSEYADIIYGGHWFSPLRGALDAFAEAAQERVTGLVRLTLHKGVYSV